MPRHIKFSGNPTLYIQTLIKTCFHYSVQDGKPNIFLEAERQQNGRAASSKNNTKRNEDRKPQINGIKSYNARATQTSVSTEFSVFDISIITYKLYSFMSTRFIRKALHIFLGILLVELPQMLIEKGII